MSGEHSIIPPSSAARRVQCAGSAVMELMHPDTTESDDAKEGTASHELGTLMIDSYAKGGLKFPTREATIGRTASNGVVWTDASYDGALMYADDVRALMIKHAVFGGVNMGVEQRVTMERLHPESWGTPDCWIRDPYTGRLYIWDYKFGHRVVEVFENWQLLEYAVGVIDRLYPEGSGIVDQHCEVVFTIVQPRAWHRDGTIRRWVIPMHEIRGYANRLHAVEHAALGPDPSTCTGPECLDCSARYACDTLRAAGSAVVQWVGKPIPSQLDPAALGSMLALIDGAEDTLKALKTGLTAQAEALILNGTPVPGWALEAAAGRVSWTVPAEQVFGLGDMLGIDLRKSPEPITPTQAKAKGLDADVIGQFSAQPLGKKQLIKSTETKAAKVFSNRGV